MEGIIGRVREKYGVDEATARAIVERSMGSIQAGKVISESVERARSLNFYDWLQTERSDPSLSWDYEYIRYLSGYLDKVVSGEITQIIFNLPPRLGKSAMITVRAPVYWMERNPKDGIVVGANNTELAISFSRRSMNIYGERNPGKLDKESEREWTNVFGGYMKPVGVGAVIVGRGADFLVIDDPVGSIEEALSPAYIKKSQGWWMYDMRTRRNRMNRTPTIIVMTRWSTDDLTGYIQTLPESKDWVVVSIPAIAESENDPLGRQIGESILPDRMPIDSLLSYKNDDWIAFSGMYQQKPIQLAAVSVEVDKIQYVEEVPLHAHRVRSWDMAATQGKGDWTVGVLMAVDDRGIIYIEDVVRGQWGPDRVEAVIRQTAETDWDLYGYNTAPEPKAEPPLMTQEGDRRVLPETATVTARFRDGDRIAPQEETVRPARTSFDYTMQTWIEQEPGASGKIVAANFVRDVLAGKDAHAEKPETNKSARARPFIAQINAGNVRIKRNPSWNQAYLNELRGYVLGLENQLDDQMDGSAQCYKKLVVERKRLSIR